MPIVTSMCTSYKQELFEAVHDHAVAGDAFNLALFTSAANLDAATETYDAVNEVPDGGNYAARGQVLTNLAPASAGTVAFTQFASPIEWLVSNITARGCQIFNTSKADRSVSVHDFGQEYVSVDGTFSVIMPTHDANSSLLRLV